MFINETFYESTDHIINHWLLISKKKKKKGGKRPPFFFIISKVFMCSSNDNRKIYIIQFYGSLSKIRTYILQMKKEFVNVDRKGVHRI